MSYAAYVSLFNSVLLLVAGFFLGKVWAVMSEFSKSLNALTDELIEQGVLPPKKLNGKNRHRGHHV